MKKEFFFLSFFFYLDAAYHRSSREGGATSALECSDSPRCGERKRREARKKAGAFFVVFGFSFFLNREEDEKPKTENEARAEFFS